MSSLKNIVLGCVSDYASEPNNKHNKISAPFDRPSHATRVKFGSLLNEAFKDDTIPSQLVQILVYIAQEGITTPDLFRRPGNPSDLKVIVKKLTEGKDIDCTCYNFYTLASVIKKFLLRIPDGFFGKEIENSLLSVLTIDEKLFQLEYIHQIIQSLSNSCQRFLSLLFGTWFRLINHSEFNSMTCESVAKSVAGGLFHSCAVDPDRVQLASEVLKILIENYASRCLFGIENLNFFVHATKTRIDVCENYKYELQYDFDNETSKVNDILSLFEKVILFDARNRGINTQNSVISFEEKNNISTTKNNNNHSNNSITSINSPNNQIIGEDKSEITHFSDIVVPNKPTISSSPCSQSILYDLSCHGDDEMKSSTKFAYSVPDICQNLKNSLEDSSDMNDDRLIASNSMSKVENMYKRQIGRLKQRTKWFLTAEIDDNIQSSSTNKKSQMKKDFFLRDPKITNLLLPLLVINNFNNSPKTIITDGISINNNYTDTLTSTRSEPPISKCNIRNICDNCNNIPITDLNNRNNNNDDNSYTNTHSIPLSMNCNYSYTCCGNNTIAGNNGDNSKERWTDASEMLNKKLFDCSLFLGSSKLSNFLFDEKNNYVMKFFQAKYFYGSGGEKR